MTSDRIQRQMDRLLDEADRAFAARDWPALKDAANDVLSLDAENKEAKTFLAAAEKNLASLIAETAPGAGSSAAPSSRATNQPTSFANGRYAVKRFLGEGGRKKVYLAHDTLLDRDVAFALIKTEGLDEVGKERVTREAQAMGRLGEHPNNVSVYDIGDESGQPYVVLPLMPGGDVEGEIENAPEHKLPLERVLQIAIDTCQGLAFAHERGILHRDIKPGNVWLATDGRAQVGDWGLAVASDRTRLTQAGMMVGTPTYMPPEQAMGGEITARSDLYSLGAMLYEMVCGRPPFVGDESVAIIGQHLNTPPVAPTWHRPDCPPALEALILRLLEKDPNKRPESASVVREALQAIGQSGNLATVGAQFIAPDGGAAGTNPRPLTPDPLYRRTFVGREHELRQLQGAFDNAISGQGGLVMVVGEPGIGKTALCEQLMTYVAMRGGKALAGHCYEEGSLSLPYLPFVEAMRGYVLQRKPDGLRSDLGTGAADVARIVSEVRDRLSVELRPAGDPEDDRWRLLQAVTSFLRNASTVQPLLLVLEDLHWADRGTLDLLLHVARNLQGARILIIGNYRDVEVDRAHPLSGALADLRRIGSFASIRLRGLSIDEVQRMMTNVRGQEQPLSRAELIHRQTEGNPLFVQEVLRYLVEEGIVVREGGRYAAADPSAELAIPEGLRDVVGKRLSRLSPECNRLLAIAAVIGRDFNLETLRTVAGLGPSTSSGRTGIEPARPEALEGPESSTSLREAPDTAEEALLTSLEEALRIGVLEERSRTGQVSYRFAHAFFRQTLYEEMIAPRRLRLHQEVARALETQYGARREEHAAELAEHFAESTDKADLAKAVEYGELAAQRAMSVYAYAEAASHLERCLAVEEILDPEDKKKRCDLLLALGQTLVDAGEFERAAGETAEETFLLAQRIEDPKRACAACKIATRALFVYRAGRAFSTPEYKVWAERYDANAGADDIDRIGADVARANVALGDGRWQDTWNILQQALQRARHVGDSDSLYDVVGRLIAPPHLAENAVARLHLAEEFLSLSREGVPVRALLGFFAGSLYVFRDWGDRARAEQLLHELDVLADRTRYSALVLASGNWHRHFDVVDGRLESIANAAIGPPEIDTPSVSSRIVFNAFKPRLLLGRVSEAMDSLDLFDKFFEGAPAGGGSETEAGMRAVCYAYLGQKERAKDLVDQILARADRPGLKPPFVVFVYLLETAVLIGDKSTTTRVLPELKGLGRLTSAQEYNTSVGRVLGEAELLLGHPEKARAHFDEALESCQKLQFRPEIALIRLDLAELLLEHYPDERAAAIEHLDFAISEFREMKMQPSLERALRHRGLLKA